MSDRLDRDGVAFTIGLAYDDARADSHGDARIGTPVVAGVPGDADLPAHNEVRWVRRRKAQVVAAVRGGILSLNDALGRYSLSLEEFIEWEREVGRELQERRRSGRMRELTKSRHGEGRRAN